jgi:hypothetical protein
MRPHSSSRAVIKVMLGVALLWPTTTAFADDRIYFDLIVNDHKLKVLFNTDLSISMILRPTAERLGLAVEPAPADLVAGGIVGITEECNVGVGGSTQLMTLAVTDVPAGVVPEFDGMFGWTAFRQKIVLLDARNRALTQFADLPKGIADWKQFRVRAAADGLELEVPGETHSPPRFLRIATSVLSGVRLGTGEWRAWESAHVKEPATLVPCTAADGKHLVSSKEMWAETLAISSLRLTDVTVSEEADNSQPELAATLGIAALSRLRIIVDGKNGVAYLSPSADRGRPPEHNRLGAFFNGDRERNLLVARVANGTPADKAGIRDGDVLKKIDGRDVTGWQDEPKVYALFGAVSGTKLHLTIERDGKQRAVEVELKDIIGPNAK